MKLNFLSLLMFTAGYPDYAGGYTGEISKATRDALTKSKYSDFTASLTYYVAERVGGGDADSGTPLFVMRAKTVDSGDLLRSCSEFIEDVIAGRAYTSAT